MKLLHVFRPSQQKKLSKNLKLLLSIHAMFVIANGLSNIFLNLFIWKMSQSLSTVINYNIVGFITLPITFIIGGLIGKKKNLKINLVLGMTLYSLFYIFIIFIRTNITSYIVLIGVLRGISSGFYYVAFNVIAYDYSHDENRDYFFGVLGILSFTINMIAPLLAGYIISYFSDITGYSIIFITSFILFFIGSIMSITLPVVHTNSKFRLVYVLMLTFKRSNWTRVMISESARAAREPKILSIVINILLFTIVKQESTIGNYSFWVFLVSTISAYIAGLLINPRNRVKYLFLGSIITISVSTLFLFNISILTFWIFGIINAIANNLLYIPQNSSAYSVFSSIPKSKERRIESVITKEIYLNIGRLITLTTFALLSSNTTYLLYFFFLLGMSPIIMWLMLRKVNTTQPIYQLVEYNSKNNKNTSNTLAPINTKG